MTSTRTTGSAGQLGFLEARRRTHTRFEDWICTVRDTRHSRLPTRKWKINEAWVQVAAAAADDTSAFQRPGPRADTIVAAFQPDRRDPRTHLSSAERHRST